MDPGFTLDSHWILSSFSIHSRSEEVKKMAAWQLVLSPFDARRLALCRWGQESLPQKIMHVCINVYIYIYR